MHYIIFIYLVKKLLYNVHTQVGFQMRTAVISAIFKKSLQLSSTARQKYSTGMLAQKQIYQPDS